MLRPILTALLALGLFSGSSSVAQTVERVHGGDTFVGGATVNQSFSADRNIFAIGNVISAKGTARGDMHLLGFDVDQATRVNGSLYATGMTVTLGAPIGGDATATGFSVRNTGEAAIGGNAVLIGNTVSIDGPISGALTGFGQNLVLNAQIDGDVWLVGENISFGPDALIVGQLIYSSEDPVSVPDHVISADRVHFEEMRPSEIMARINENWQRVEYPVLPAFMTLFAMFLVSLVFFVALAAVFQTFLPKPLGRMQAAIIMRPGQVFLFGVMGLSMLFGIVPIVALTVFGLPLVPIALLAIIAAWVLGYGLAGYAIAQRMLQAFSGKDESTNLARLLAFAAVLIVVAVLNYIPFLGWVVNYTLVLLGIGAMTGAVFHRFTGNSGTLQNADTTPIET